MTWNDDSWRDSYDAWKLRSPDEEYEEYQYNEEPECDCVDYESDILTGVAVCHACGRRWLQTQDEIEQEILRQAEYDEQMRLEERRQRWEWLARPWRAFWYRVIMPFSPKKAVSVLRDDEIPF